MTDAREVVRTRAEAAALDRPPLLVLDALRDFLDENAIGQGDLAWSRIGEGQSNVTFDVRRGPTRVVVRRGPRPPLPRSTHDMVREARVQRFVGGHGIPVPRVLAVCEDESVLGVPFYVMEYLDGEVITDDVPVALSSPDARRATGDALVDLLVQLHRVPVDGPEAQTLGRPVGYLQRQVERFGALWGGNTTRDLPAVARIGTWLATHLPATQRAAVVHGDYRMGNLMFASDGPGRVRALLDWEMATLGDPLADLGYLVATYAGADRPATVMELTSVTREPGYPTRAELVERYAAGSGLDVSALPWYETLALWKAAIFCEAIHTRWLRGERPDDTRFAPALTTGVPRLLDLAESSAARMS